LAVTSDAKSGSLFDLGEWVELSRPIANPCLPERQQNYIGSESMFVRCSWELDSPVDLIPVGVELHGFEERTRLLEALVGSRIAEATFSAAPLEFWLRFENQMSLRLCLAQASFREQALRLFGSASLTVSVRDSHWSVRPNGEISEALRSAGL
jgi:hypothetical protein